MAVFEQRKKRILEELQSDEPDLSPKGKPDEEILALLELINSHEDYVSTSSCSGRAVVFLDADKSGTGEEAQGRWLMTRHTQFEKGLESSTTKELYATLFGSVKIGQDGESSRQFTRLVALKFEPLVKILAVRPLTG
jgi:tRNA wybutosine-synthesizing protein 3